MKNIEARGYITIFLWLSYLGFIYIAMNMMGAWAALIAFVIMIPLVWAMAAIWNLFGNEKSAVLTENDVEIEKRKRERLDTVLRDLSNQDLIALRQRLADGTIDDDMLYNQIVGDDGEFIYHQSE